MVFGPGPNHHTRTWGDGSEQWVHSMLNENGEVASKMLSSTQAAGLTCCMGFTQKGTERVWRIDRVCEGRD